jgi:hypothetical protein
VVGIGDAGDARAASSFNAANENIGPSFGLAIDNVLEELISYTVGL